MASSSGSVTEIYDVRGVEVVDGQRTGGRRQRGAASVGLSTANSLGSGVDMDALEDAFVDAAFVSRQGSRTTPGAPPAFRPQCRDSPGSAVGVGGNVPAFRRNRALPIQMSIRTLHSCRTRAPTSLPGPFRTAAKRRPGSPVSERSASLIECHRGIVTACPTPARWGYGIGVVSRVMERPPTHAIRFGRPCNWPTSHIGASIGAAGATSPTAPLRNECSPTGQVPPLGRRDHD